MPPDHCELGGTSSTREAVPESGTAPRYSHYTELRGETGRRAYFRPERYPAEALGAGEAVVSLTHAGHERRCPLRDVSQSGLAFEWPEDLPIEVGAELDEIALRLDQHVAYRGRAAVSSVRRTGRQALVGASFTDGLMDIEDVLHLRDVKAHIADAAASGVRIDRAPWRVAEHHRFKSRVAELRLFLEDAQQRFAELEQTLPWSVVHGDQSCLARRALIERIRDGFVADVVEACNGIADALGQASFTQRDALREYSERHLGAFFMLSPWMHRARHKPLGYPGDFEVMNGLYGRHFDGATLFAKALNVAMVSLTAAEAVRTRKDLLKQQISEQIDAYSDGRPVRVLSIAAGPAQEIYELLEERQTLEAPLQIVLFDQDASALSFSYGRLSRLVNARWKDQVEVLHLHDSITRLLRGTSVLTGSGTFDLVYSCGLFDYLRPNSWVSLYRGLYEMVGPGGSLLVGNMVPDCPTRWVMELHLDWFLEYRDHDALRALANKAVPGVPVEILEEATGFNPFVKLSRC